MSGDERIASGSGERSDARLVRDFIGQALAHDALAAEATSTNIAGLLDYLATVLGDRVAAYLGGATHADPYTAAAGGGVSEIRLREGYRVVSMIETPYDSETAKAWLFGTNARLGNQAPIEALAEAATAEQFADVRRAARHFATAAA